MLLVVWFVCTLHLAIVSSPAYMSYFDPILLKKSASTTYLYLVLNPPTLKAASLLKTTTEDAMTAP